MSVSIPGLLVCVVLLILGQALVYPVIVALLASLAIGSDGFCPHCQVSAVLTPLIYTLFAMILIIRLAVRRDCLTLVGAELARHPTNIVILFLVIYTFGTVWILPRLFMGETSTFTPIEGEIREFPLAPVSEILPSQPISRSEQSPASASASRFGISGRFSPSSAAFSFG